MVEHRIWQGINSTLQGYADALDRGDMDALVEVFTQDAILDYTPGAPRKGRGEILDHFCERQSKMERTSHHVGPPVVVARPGEKEFESTSYFIANHLLKGGGQYVVYGRYVDVLKESNGGFLIAHRRIIAHMTEGTNRQYVFIERKPVSAKK